MFNLRQILEGLPSCFSWKNNIQTYMIVGSFNAFFLAYVISGQNLLQLLSSLAYYAVIISVIYGLVLKYAYGQNLNEESSQNKEFVSQASIQQLVLKVISVVNELKNFFQQCSQSIAKLVQFIVICYIVEILGSLFTLGTWTWILINFLYICTFLKEVKKIQVSDYIDIVLQAPQELVSFVADNIPKYDNTPHHQINIGHENKNDETQ
ncbi:hypothetical protein PPERSA_11487 [Pseudocohnilembus persalinus]|uniref:Reticulon domain-containing protein n=1 Tax=Pseudocohnilembus persalinus TaxID=266149 RepID=A0A0V0QXQ4_PSEPJ|nr:hypothetical protein PPERSA_11487 [Pseudocohnilembus persalinus]|eukprot:KRX06842.1 hypothetical protein PPERSA_11487 [Pseudocohnilembus persalinus]